MAWAIEESLKTAVAEGVLPGAVLFAKDKSGKFVDLHLCPGACSHIFICIQGKSTSPSPSAPPPLTLPPRPPWNPSRSSLSLP